MPARLMSDSQEKGESGHAGVCVLSGEWDGSNNSQINVER